jgi:glucose/arabinose dehydrogenase
MLAKHPILSSMAVIAALFFVFACYSARTGVLSLPGGMVVSLDVMWHALSGAQVEGVDDATLERRMSLPDGFAIDTYATGLPNVRLLAVTPAGDLLASLPRRGEVVLLPREKGGGDARVLLSGLDRPHGIDWKDGWLYIGEASAIARVRFDPDTRRVKGVPERFITGLPEGGNHWTRTVHVGPDDRIYVSVGSSCNVCEEEDPRRAAILRYELDGSGEEIYADGLRNSVDFAWHPVTGDLYATDNGRDLLGDDFPPGEINRVVRGGFYGWPYRNGAGLSDPDFGGKAPEREAAAISPAHELPAHSAPLGMAFYTADAFPERYRDAAFVALHGSWNRSRKQGYEVVVVRFREDGSSERETFLSGFEVDEAVSGRPVGIAVGPEGELFVSDDYTGSIYRVRYGTAQQGGAIAAAVPMRASGDPLANVGGSERVQAESRGAALWRANACGTCHIEGEGNAPPRVLSKLASRYDLASMEQFLLAPQPPMPRYSFTPKELRDLSIYLFVRFGGKEEESMP